MRNVAMLLCAVLLAAAPPGAQAATAEADSVAVMRYVLKLFNARAVITATMRNGEQSGEMGAMMRAASEHFDVDALGSAMGPALLAQMPADQVRACAEAVRLPESASLLAAVPVSEDPVAALMGLPPVPRQALEALFQRPCMAGVVAVMNSAEASAIAGKYGKALACEAVSEDAVALQVLRDAGQCAR